MFDMAVEGVVAAGRSEVFHSAEAAVSMCCSIVLVVEAARRSNAEMAVAVVAEDVGRSLRAQSLVSRRMESFESVAPEDSVRSVSMPCLPSESAPLGVAVLVVVAVEPD
jgi:hypothetical protein